MRSKDIYEGKFVITPESDNQTSKAKKIKVKPVRVKPQKASSANGNPNKKRWVPLLVAAILGIIAVITGIIYYSGAQAAISDAKTLKTSIKQAVASIKDGDADSADENIRNAEIAIKSLKENLDDKKWNAARSIPFAGSSISEDLDTASKAIDIADEATEQILKLLIVRLSPYKDINVIHDSIRVSHNDRVTALYDHGDRISHCTCSNTAGNLVVSAMLIDLGKFCVDLMYIRFSGIEVRAFTPSEFNRCVGVVIFQEARRTVRGLQ